MAPGPPRASDLARCLEREQALAFETVFSAADKPEFVRRALTLGYFVKIIDRWGHSIPIATSVAAEVDRF